MLKMIAYQGTSVVTDLGFDIKINPHSTLMRQWFVISDDTAPAYVDGKCGVVTQYTKDPQGYSGQFEYVADYQVTAAEPLSAIEVRMQVFDVFGRAMQVLRSSDVIDLSGSRRLKGTWHTSETDVSDAFTSVIYVSQARTALGKVYAIDHAALLEQLVRVNAKLTEADLEPKR